jgi:hypothetical protein
MFETELRLYEFSLGLAKRMAAEIDESEMNVRPGDGSGNPPVWILGHLAVSTDFALRALGRPMLCPPAWLKMFGPGSDSGAVPEPRPTKADLMAALERGHAAVTAAVREADPAALDRPHTIPFFQGTPLRTVGDTLALLLTTHEGLHLGQLSAWRRTRGRKAMF